MKHIAYVHAPNVSLIGAMTDWLRHRLVPPSTTSPGGEPWSRWRPRLLKGCGWILVLVIQALLVILVRDVIQLAHGVVGLYLDLAKLQLDLTSQYVAATKP
jgi:hypothetical protein